MSRIRNKSLILPSTSKLVVTNRPTCILTWKIHNNLQCKPKTVAKVCFLPMFKKKTIGERLYSPLRVVHFVSVHSKPLIFFFFKKTSPQPFVDKQSEAKTMYSYTGQEQKSITNAQPFKQFYTNDCRTMLT